MQNSSSASSSPSLVYLPKSLVAGERPDSFDIVYSVAVFTNDLLYKGFFLPNELPKNVMQLYYVDYYFGQVMNGGHSQFIENTIEDDFEAVIAFALQGFAAMGADTLARPLGDMVTWLRESDFLGRFTEGYGFDDDAWEYLEKLDGRLGEAHEEMPIEDLQATWLLSWENLRIVEDTELARIRSELLKSNPMLLPRKIKERVSRLLAKYK